MVHISIRCFRHAYLALWGQSESSTYAVQRNFKKKSGICTFPYPHPAFAEPPPRSSIFTSAPIGRLRAGHFHSDCSERPLCASIFTSSHPHILTSSHLHILTSSHLHILTSSHLHISTPTHLPINIVFPELVNGFPVFVPYLLTARVSNRYQQSNRLAMRYP